jgi:hypothetical protein
MPDIVQIAADEPFTKDDIVHLNVPFREKDVAKAHGARFDGESKRWYVPAGENLAPFKQWIWIDLHCPYAEKDMVKSLGAKYDGETKKWQIPMSANQESFKRWLYPWTPLNVSAGSRNKVKKLGAVCENGTWFAPGDALLAPFLKYIKPQAIAAASLSADAPNTPDTPNTPDSKRPRMAEGISPDRRS